jgi:large subunit ribosomal protein L2
MAIISQKPTSPGRRFYKKNSLEEITKTKPERSLVTSLSKTGGRNSYGRITSRHRGGGHKRKYRIIDFKRDKFGIEAKVLGLYFDPNRSAHLALLQYADGEKRYIIAPRGIKVGSSVVSNDVTDILPGNAMRIKNIPSGTIVHCVESKVGMGATFGRSAGQAIVVQGIDPTGKYVQIKMPSGEIRLVPADAMATIGQVGNEEKINVKLGKAGRSRNLGKRPVVRGMAMHAVEHPHGGGEGRGVVGRAKDIWGHRVGTRTRKNKRTDKLIIKRRRTRQRPFAKK